MAKELKITFSDIIKGVLFCVILVPLCIYWKDAILHYTSFLFFIAYDKLSPPVFIALVIALIIFFYVLTVFTYKRAYWNPFTLWRPMEDIEKKEEKNTDELKEKKENAQPGT